MGRIVFDYLGEGTPGWDVRYVDEVRLAQTEVIVLDIDRERILEATITGVGRVSSDDGRAADLVGGSQTVTAPVTEIVSEVRYTGLHDGGNQFFIGLDTPVGQPETNAYTLTDPVRVVIEVLRCG